MDNGTMKIRTGHFKPSQEMINNFHKYSSQGLNNEMIAMITGYRKHTVDKYVSENAHVTNAWNNIKVYANQQMKAAAKEMHREHNAKLDKQISDLKKKVVELEKQKKEAEVSSFNWYLKADSNKMVAKHNKSDCREKHKKAEQQFYTLFSDHQWHKQTEVDEILQKSGYAKSSLNTRSYIVRSMFKNIVIKRGRCSQYMIPASVLS